MDWRPVQGVPPPWKSPPGCVLCGRCVEPRSSVRITVGVEAALFAAPYRSDFMKALSKGRDVKEEECLEKMRKFLVNFSATVDAIYELYNKMNADLIYTM